MRLCQPMNSSLLEHNPDPKTAQTETNHGGYGPNLMKHQELLDLTHSATEELQEWQSFTNPGRNTEVLIAGKEETCNP